MGNQEQIRLLTKLNEAFPQVDWGSTGGLVLADVEWCAVWVRATEEGFTVEVSEVGVFKTEDPVATIRQMIKLRVAEDKRAARRLQHSAEVIRRSFLTCARCEDSGRIYSSVPPGESTPCPECSSSK